LSLKQGGDNHDYSRHDSIINIGRFNNPTKKVRKCAGGTVPKV